MTTHNFSITRRSLLQGAAAAGLGLAAIRPGANAAPLNLLLAPAGTPVVPVDEVVIDLSAEPANIDPATTYDVGGWSIVHSLYDSLVQYDASGNLQGVAAESMTEKDALTWVVKLRSGLTFHNGDPVDSSAIGFSQQHIATSETSTIKGNFATIKSVTVVDELTAEIALTAPSPWLPAQIALWMVLLPPKGANDLLKNPIGSGPYSFVEWIPGDHLTLAANPNYPADSVKGQPIAKKVTFRFVPETSTRVADVLSGTAGIIRDISIDQQKPLTDGGANVIVNDVSGTSFIRVANDVAPFNDARVRQALNYAVDVEGIIATLNGGNGKALANFYPPSGIGYAASLAPYSFDPDKAKSLLKEAGAENIQTTIEYATSERADVCEAIAAQLTDVGIKTDAKSVEIATFNGTWQDKSTSPLRYVSWRPMFDPYTLLSLVVSAKGFLTRYSNPTAQPLIDQAAAEFDPAKRAALYVQLGQILHDDPAAIYLWNLTSIYGDAKTAPVWTPRPDDILLPTRVP